MSRHLTLQSMVFPKPASHRIVFQYLQTVHAKVLAECCSVQTRICKRWCWAISHVSLNNSASVISYPFLRVAQVFIFCECGEPWPTTKSCHFQSYLAIFHAVDALVTDSPCCFHVPLQYICLVILELKLHKPLFKPSQC